jgi:uncharacterized protein (DUF433 family)
MTVSEGAKQPFATRLRASTLERLREHADELDVPQTALVERYIEEGVRMDAHPLIGYRDGAAGRRPVLAGTRHDVWQVIETIRQNGNSVERAADYLRLPVSHVEACAAFYADYQEEVDAWGERVTKAAERAEATWRRRHALFA